MNLIKALVSVTFNKRKDYFCILLLLKKENEILKRHLNLHGRRITSNNTTQILSIINYCHLNKSCFTSFYCQIRNSSGWQRRFIKKQWSFKQKKRGRKPVTVELKKLILEMKTDNPSWGCRRISDELKKLDIKIHYTTVNKIIQKFRKLGMIQPTGI